MTEQLDQANFRSNFTANFVHFWKIKKKNLWKPVSAAIQLTNKQRKSNNSSYVKYIRL